MPVSSGLGTNGVFSLDNFQEFNKSATMTTHPTVAV